MSREVEKGDLLIVVLLVIALLSTFEAVCQRDVSSGRMETAVIKIDGEIYATIPLKRSNERQEIPLIFRRPLYTDRDGKTKFGWKNHHVLTKCAS